MDSYLKIADTVSNKWRQGDKLDRRIALDSVASHFFMIAKKARNSFGGASNLVRRYESARDLRSVFWVLANIRESGKFAREWMALDGAKTDWSKVQYVPEGLGNKVHCVVELCLAHRVFGSLPNENVMRLANLPGARDRDVPEFVTVVDMDDGLVSAADINTLRRWGNPFGLDMVRLQTMGIRYLMARVLRFVHIVLQVRKGKAPQLHYRSMTALLSMLCAAEGDRPALPIVELVDMLFPQAYVGRDMVLCYLEGLNRYHARCKERGVKFTLPNRDLVAYIGANVNRYPGVSGTPAIVVNLSNLNANDSGAQRYSSNVRSVKISGPVAPVRAPPAPAPASTAPVLVPAAPTPAATATAPAPAAASPAALAPAPLVVVAPSPPPFTVFSEPAPAPASPTPAPALPQTPASPAEPAPPPPAKRQRIRRSQRWTMSRFRSRH